VKAGCNRSCIGPSLNKNTIGSSKIPELGDYEVKIIGMHKELMPRVGEHL
jgi:hypothetical protein